MSTVSRSRRAVVLLGLLALAACGKDKSATGPSSSQLVGQWVATKWEYTNQANTSQKVDFVAEGITATLTINASTYTIAFSIPGVGTQTITGTWTQNGSNFVITETGASDSETITFSFSNNNNTLTMSDTQTNYDFDSDGTDDPATLSMTFTRS